MANTETFILTIIGIYLAVLLIVFLIQISKYNEFVELKRKENSNSGIDNEQWIAGTFYAKLPMKIEDKSENNQVKKIIISHNKVVTLFWIWLALIIPIIITINLLEK